MSAKWLSLTNVLDDHLVALKMSQIEPVTMANEEQWNRALGVVVGSPDQSLLKHWTNNVSELYSFLSESFQNVVVVGQSSPNSMFNSFLNDPDLFPLNNDVKFPSTWTGVVKIVHGPTKLFRVLPKYTGNIVNSADVPTQFTSFGDETGRNKLQSWLVSTALDASIVIQHPFALKGIAVFDTTRVGTELVSLVQSYLRNTDAIVFTYNLETAPRDFTPYEAAVLDAAVLELPRITCFVAAHQRRADRQTFNYQRLMKNLMGGWPSLFELKQDNFLLFKHQPANFVFCGDFNNVEVHQTAPLFQATRAATPTPTPTTAKGGENNNASQPSSSSTSSSTATTTTTTTTTATPTTASATPSLTSSSASLTASTSALAPPPPPPTPATAPTSLSIANQLRDALFTRLAGRSALSR